MVNPVVLGGMIGALDESLVPFFMIIVCGLSVPVTCGVGGKCETPGCSWEEGLTNVIPKALGLFLSLQGDEEFTFLFFPLPQDGW